MGNLMQDQELLDLSEVRDTRKESLHEIDQQSWTKEATQLWREFDAPGEFNSPTYAGVTLMAFGLAQYCPPNSAIYLVAPELLNSTWRSLGETYNPSLRNIAGPWDRTYGYCMTRYFATVGVPIACVIDQEEDGMLHMAVSS
jgi:hypothetical protein